MVELLAVIAIIAILAALLLPSLASAKQTGWQAQCLNNHRQLNLAVREFAGDHDSRFPYASAWPNEPTARWAWVAGSMSGGGNWAQTDRPLFWSPLKPYAGMKIFKCPGDKSTVTWKRSAATSSNLVDRIEQRPRSYSMNIFVGGWSGWPFMYDNQVKVHHKYDDVEAPSRLFSFIEMPAASINAGNFRVVPKKGSSKDAFSMDWPGVYHNGGSVVSFVDGHAEFRRWLEFDTKNIPLEAGDPTTIGKVVESEGNRDLAWLRARAIVPDPNNHNWQGWFSGIGRYNREWNAREIDGKRYDSWGWFWNETW